MLDQNSNKKPRNEEELLKFLEICANKRNF